MENRPSGKIGRDFDLIMQLPRLQNFLMEPKRRKLLKLLETNLF